MTIQFQYREFVILFAALLLLTLLFAALLIWKKKVKKRIGDIRLVNALITGYSARKFTSKFVICSFAFAAGVLAVMNPRKPGGSDNINRKGIDVVVALDVSKSMLATDLAPNRLERARQFIGKLIQAMPDDRIGLVVFAGRAYLQMPLTLDHAAAGMFVAAAAPDAIPQQGTMLTEALNTSANAFNRADKRFKTVLLISDGEDHDDKAATTATELAEQGILVNTIGIGSAEGAAIPDPATGENKKDAAGNTIISKLNEETLKQVAANTNGIYVRLQASDEAVTQVTKQLAQIEGKAFGDVSLMNFKTYYMWFAGGMLFFLLLEFFISEKKKTRV